MSVIFFDNDASKTEKTRTVSHFTFCELVFLIRKQLLEVNVGVLLLCSGVVSAIVWQYCLYATVDLQKSWC